ncbi:hypothetical protein [Winogradskyella sp.]|uniref:hypothetical protein n=1 Tax=Winogradskyella sp. TaxID=1883156 RepID=UPI003BAC12EE
MKFIKNISIVVVLLITGIMSAQVKFEAKTDIEELKDRVFIITELDKTNFLVSDSIVVKYKLFVSHDTGIENWNEAYKPLYKDFEMNDSKRDDLKIVKEAYKGEDYRTVVFKEVILNPNKKGNLVLPAYALNVQVSIPSKTEKNAFGRFKMQKQDITITTDKIKITVK